MIVIIDYGMGNLRSVQKALERLGFPVCVSADPDIVRRADRLILPGVGAFRDCMGRLVEGGFVEPILRHIEAGRPFLGICLGMQLLFAESEEFGRHRGLGILPGRVIRFRQETTADGVELKVPHMGWNRLHLCAPSPLFHGVEEGSFVYFVHSYHVIPEEEAVVAATTDYGLVFCSSICKDNITACQFHPEKSQQVGLKILNNFGGMK
ncbi:MAG: imidazole glycerol phosphate synthase subunit HisH [Deltaproteobacteria bacterium]|nr:imidazole glycerol phosphate synthase subunit HisH [Deltaproteobacteria bacterium]